MVAFYCATSSCNLYDANIGGVTIYLQPFTPSAQSSEMVKLLPEMLEPTHANPTPSNSKSVEERVN